MLGERCEKNKSIRSRSRKQESRWAKSLRNIFVTSPSKRTKQGMGNVGALDEYEVQNQVTVMATVRIVTANHEGGALRGGGGGVAHPQTHPQQHKTLAPTDHGYGGGRRYGLGLGLSITTRI